MSTRTKQIYFAVGVAIALVVAVVVLTVRWPVPGRLPDGTRVVLENVTYGTNHVVPKAPLEGLFRRLPSKWSEKIHRKPSSGRKTTTDRSVFTFWLNLSSPASAIQPIGYAIADENGFEAPMVFLGAYSFYSPAGFAKNHVGLVRGSGIFPHRSRKFFLRLYQQDGEGKRHRVAEFLIRNKGFEDPAGWKPQDLPPVKAPGSVIALRKI